MYPSTTGRFSATIGYVAPTPNHERVHRVQQSIVCVRVRSTVHWPHWDFVGSQQRSPSNLFTIEYLEFALLQLLMAGGWHLRKWLPCTCCDNVIFFFRILCLHFPLCIMYWVVLQHSAGAQQNATTCLLAMHMGYKDSLVLHLSTNVNCNVPCCMRIWLPVSTTGYFSCELHEYKLQTQTKTQERNQSKHVVTDRSRARRPTTDHVHS